MFETAIALLRKLVRIFRVRFDKSPIESVDGLIEFIHTRSAYVAQTSLYGYLKTRMGRNYVSIFKDERFAPSLNTAKWKIYAACLSDLCVYAVARSGTRQPEHSSELALHCHRQCVQRTFDGPIAEAIAADAAAEFEARCGAVIWANAAIGAGAFSTSPAALADSSPVSDEFRELDREIVMNSVRFRWNDVRDQLAKRLDGDAVWEDWRLAAGRD